jgi:nucleoside-diphosphate-sugar epimerase
MHVFLTGATGFVGHHVLQELLRRGHTVRCLVREGSLEKLPISAERWALVDSSKDIIVSGVDAPDRKPAQDVEVVFGDVTDLESIEGDVKGCDAVIHLVGIIEEDRTKGLTFEKLHVRGTRNVVEQARAAGVRRFLHMSANGARPDRGASKYHTTKWEAEEIVRGGGFEQAVVFRPSLIFGDPGDDRPEFAMRLANTLVRPFPILPILGNGRYELQPIHVDDVAAAFVEALTTEFPAGTAQSFCPAGPEKLTFDEVLDRISMAMGGQPKPKLHLPLWLSRLLVSTFGSLGLMPISPPQFRMLIEGNTCDDDSFREIFRPRLTPFQPENLTYLRSDEK